MPSRKLPYTDIDVYISDMIPNDVVYMYDRTKIQFMIEPKEKKDSGEEVGECGDEGD